MPDPLRQAGRAAAALLLLGVSSAPDRARAEGRPAPAGLEARLRALAEAHPGRVGLCVQDAGAAPVCVNGGQRFALQSVMKLIIGVAVLRAVDEGRMSLGDPVTVRREDLSVNVQPIADIVARQGAFETTLGDLLGRAVIESDSAATDILVARLGGPAAVQRFLDGTGLGGIRIDRDERHLQTETSGLAWSPAFVDPAALEAARRAVPEARRAAAFQASLKDERDTATPQGMAAFLNALAAGKLLSPASTRHMLDVMARTVTFPDRLRAGAPAGWTVAHKTGTSRTLNGINGVTNDVGFLVSPAGRVIAVAAFVAESRAPAAHRAALIASAARAASDAYR